MKTSSWLTRPATSLGRTFARIPLMALLMFCRQKILKVLWHTKRFKGVFNPTCPSASQAISVGNVYHWRCVHTGARPKSNCRFASRKSMVPKSGRSNAKTVTCSLGSTNVTLACACNSVESISAHNSSSWCEAKTTSMPRQSCRLLYCRDMNQEKAQTNSFCHNCWTFRVNRLR